MYYLLAFVFGLIAGAVGAVAYYRRRSVSVEGAIGMAVKTREDAMKTIDALRKKFGG